MKGTRFRHWLSKYPFKKPISVERMPEVLSAVRCGNPVAIKEMIESYLGLGLALVARFAKIDDVVDDLVSAAFLAIVQAVNRIAAGHLTHDNVSPYIVTYIKGGLRKELAKRPVIYTPELAIKPMWQRVPLENVDASIPADNTLEVEEELASIVSDDTDIEIIRMRLLGYRAIHVAKELGISRGNVSRRITRIRIAYQENQE